MELVKGVPITRYCDERRLTPRQRLELFVPVCQAVQHAHQKGVIHRDIKPSNVLVALYDGKPVPKVIDFGIAKAAGQPLTERTLVTGFGEVVGTLEYMSPEQAELNQLDIDTRSDIYSLGVLLYELLTGTTPLEKKRLKEAALLEVLRVIREEEPPRPSARLSTTEELPSVAANRGLEPRKLSGLVRGELDWIVMKALEKDRSRRYESANGFAADVQRYLADEPVLACPPSAAYRLRKFVRRNGGRLVFATGVCVLVAAVLGSIGWAVRDRALREAERQREQAARQYRAANELALALDRAELFHGEGRRAEALAALGQAELLAGEAPADPTLGARLAALQERLEAEARDQEFVARFEDVRLRLQSQVDVQNSAFTTKEALPAIREALRRHGVALGVMPPAQAAAYIRGRPEPVRRNLVAALTDCVSGVAKGEVESPTWLIATLDAADNDAWRVRVRRALADRDRQALEQMARAADVREQPPSLLLAVASALPKQLRETRLELFRRIQRAYPADLWANHGLAMELRGAGQPAEAIRYFTAALALRPDNPGIYLNRGNALKDAGEVDAAKADYRQSLALAPEYAAAHSHLGDVLSAQGRRDEAIAEYREVIRLNKDDPEAHYNLGTTLSAQGRRDEAIAEYRAALTTKQNFPQAYKAHVNLGIALSAKGRLDEAIAEYREAIRLNKDDPKAHYNLGNTLSDQGRRDEAIAEYREAIRLNKDDPEAHTNLGNALSAKGRLDEAVAEFRAALRLKADLPEAHNGLGLALHDKGRLDEAIAEYRAAIRLKKDSPQTHNNLGRTFLKKGQLDEAVAEYRAAIRIKKDYARAHYGLGLALSAQGRLDEAIAEYRAALTTKQNFPQADKAHVDLGKALSAKGRLDEAIAEYRAAIRLKADFPETHNGLGNALKQRGEFRQALEELRRGHELGSKDPRWPYPSARWVRQCERLVELDEQLPGLLAGTTTPAGPAERIELAGLCSLKRLHRAAARFYGEAFAAQAALADDLGAAHRYNAACAAALAGVGQGQDARDLDEKGRARLRQQALDWLRADLAACARVLDTGAEQARPLALRRMQESLADPDFAGVREPEALARLPERERQAWQQLWADARDRLARAQGPATPKKEPATR
jgi:tetratricopeptide (TPR) repeat protein